MLFIVEHVEFEFLIWKIFIFFLSPFLNNTFLLIFIVLFFTSRIALNLHLLKFNEKLENTLICLNNDKISK